MSKKVVITGGAGFIGSHIADIALEEGYKVHLVDNLENGKKKHVHPSSALHEIDIRDLKPLKEVFENTDTVFHTAALPRVQYSIEHPQETFDVNVMGTLNVLVAAHETGVRRVVYSASSSAYGDQPVLPLVEDMQAQPKSPYGLQKYIGELQCRTWSEVYDLETVSLRYFNVYGPRFDPTGPYALVIGKFLKLQQEGKPLTITGDGSQTRDFTHVTDVARANLLAMKSAKVGGGEVINIGAGNNCSINDLAKLIGGPVAYVEARLEPHDTLANTTLAKELIGWEPKVSLKEGIEDLKTNLE